MEGRTKRQEKRTTIDARARGRKGRVEGIDCQLETRDRTRRIDYESPFDFAQFSLLEVVFNPNRNTRIEKHRREESARGMLESKTGKVRKAGGKDVCAGICVAGRERNVKGER